MKSKVYLLIIFLFLGLTAIASQQTENFELNYEVLTVPAVCWQTCRDSRCEEADYDIFWDLETYKIINKARSEGYLVHREAGKNCYDGSITQVPDHMPNLMKKSPDKANEILKSQGTKIKIVLYSNLNNKLKLFLEQLLK